MQKLKLGTITYTVHKRIEGEEGKTNTLVYLTRPKGLITHIAAEYKRPDGSVYYSKVEPMHGIKIK